MFLDGIAECVPLGALANVHINSNSGGGTAMQLAQALWCPLARTRAP